jgi:hypothetical protein
MREMISRSKRNYRVMYLLKYKLIYAYFSIVLKEYRNLFINVFRRI